MQLLANVALSVLDDHFAQAWQRDMATRTQRTTRRSHGEATYRLVRYADLFGYPNNSAYPDDGVIPRVVDGGGCLACSQAVGVVWSSG